jgi:transposase
VAVLGPRLFAPVRASSRGMWTKRLLIDGIRWRVRVGASWRDVPDCYGSWQVVCGVFHRWQRDGTWVFALASLQARAEAAGPDRAAGETWTPPPCAHTQHAAGARREAERQREQPGGTVTEPDVHALGRSRDGLSTKLHLPCERGP